MSTKARIALGIAFLLTVIAVLGALGVYHLQAIERRNAEVYRDHFLQLTTTEQAIRELNELSTALLSEDVELTERAISRFEESLLVALPNRDSVAVVDVAADYLIRRLDRDVANLLVRLRERDADGMLRDASRASAIRLILEINGALHSLFTQDERAVAFAFRDNQRTTAAAQRQMIVLGAVCVLFALGVLVWLPTYVAEPLERFANSIQDIARGNYKTRLPVDRSDEFGRLAVSFNMMAARLDDASAQNLADVIASRNRLTTLVNQLDELILGIDRDRVIVFLNRPMEEYLGLEAESALGQYMPDLALAKPRLQQLFEPIALGDGVQPEPFAVTRPDGSQAYFQERVVTLAADAAGEPSGYIILLRDVTDFAERSNRQSDFLATLSHEMKTPVAAIEMCLNLLGDERIGTLDEGQRELADVMRENNQRLLRMVNEVLQLSQNEAGEVQLNIERVNLPRLLAETEAEIRPLLAGKDLRVETSTPADLYSVEADGERLRWVVRNLLTNAIRYAPAASAIEVDVRNVAGGVRLSVADRGPGVPADQREAIFRKYRRASGDKTVGTGLGLTISREYVAAHGGRLYVDEDYTEGARFVVELPRQLSEVERQRHAITAG